MDGGNFLNSLNVCGVSRSGVSEFKNLVRFGVVLRQVILSVLVVPQVGSRFRLKCLLKGILFKIEVFLS